MGWSAIPPRLLSPLPRDVAEGRLNRVLDTQQPVCFDGVERRGV